MKVGKGVTHVIQRQWVEEVEHGRWRVVVEETPQARARTLTDWLTARREHNTSEALTGDSTASHEVEGYPYDDSPAD